MERMGSDEVGPGRTWPAAGRSGGSTRPSRTGRAGPVWPIPAAATGRVWEGPTASTRQTTRFGIRLTPRSHDSGFGSPSGAFGIHTPRIAALPRRSEVGGVRKAILEPARPTILGGGGCARNSRRSPPAARDVSRTHRWRHSLLLVQDGTRARFRRARRNAKAEAVGSGARRHCAAASLTAGAADVDGPASAVNGLRPAGLSNRLAVGPSLTTTGTRPEATVLTTSGSGIVGDGAVHGS
jgi:hypothetical protein